jgi:hypothetical protein
MFDLRIELEPLAFFRPGGGRPPRIWRAYRIWKRMKGYLGAACKNNDN